MIKFYQYGIQWVFPVRSFQITPRQCMSDIEKVLKVLGARSLDSIGFLDSDYKNVYSYTDFLSYNTGDAEKKAMIFIKKFIKENDKVWYIELYRRAKR